MRVTAAAHFREKTRRRWTVQRLMRRVMWRKTLWQRDWPNDAKYYIYTDGEQFNYGYKDGYFDSIVAKIEAVDKTAFADLVANVRKAETLAKKALSELENGNYTYESKYLEMFGVEGYVYTLNKGEELKSEMNAIYKEFSAWLGSWEL